MNKKELRAILRERSAGLPEEYIESAGRAIAANVEGSRLYEDADRIFIYVSMPREPGTDEIIEDALSKGKKVYVPRCIKGSEHLMESVRITSLDDLEAGSYGIREPHRCEGDLGGGASGEICRPEDLELAIVPCVSAWTDGRRLGHGAGYYDRFLAHCSCPKLILCFERMLDERIEMDEHDIYMDVVVTESGMHYTECPPEAGSNSREVPELITGDMIAALTSDYLNVYVIEPEADQGSILKLEGYMVDGIEKKPRNFNYSTMLRRYAENSVCDEDRTEFLKVILPDSLIKSFADGRKRLELNYRVPVSDRLEHYSGLYIRISKKTEPLKLLAGFRSTEDIITIQSRNRKEGMYSAYDAVSDLYLAMFRINIKKNTYFSIKTTEAVLKHTIPGSDRYDENLRAIITALADEDSLASALDFLDLNTIEERMRGKKHIFTYFNGKIAGLCKLHLIKEDSDADENLRHVILAVEVLEEAAKSYKELDEMHAIFDASKMGTWSIYLIDGENPRMEADDLMRELLGIAGKKLTQKETYDAWFSNITPEALQSVLHSVKKMKKEGRAENTYLWNHPVLGERYVRCGGTAKPVKGGFVLRGYHYDVDEVVREQKKKDKALAEQVAITNTLARNFKNVFVANLNSGTARVVRLAEDYDVKAVRSVMEKEFTYEPVIKQWIRENVYQNDKKRIEESFSFDNLRKVFSKQDEFSGTYRSEEGGKLHHYQFDFRKADDSGNVVAGFQIIDAIVEEHEQQAKREKELEDARLRGEREHAAVVNSLSTIYSTIFTADIDTCRYQILTSVPLMGEVAKSSGNFNDVKDEIIDSFMAPEFRDSMREFLNLGTLAERLKGVNTITTEYKAPTGQWMQSRFIVKRRDKDGTTKEILYVARDITEEKLHDFKQQEALTQALAAAQQANKAKTTFLNSMSHDIRTPMNAIVGFTALAQTHIENQEMVQDYLGKISTSSTHLLSLINDILDMSRIESGTVRLQETDVHIPDLLHDLRIMIQSLVKAKNQNLFIDTQDVVHEDVVTDKLRLNQILLNIVGNAIKFTQTGGDIIIRLVERPCSLKNYATYEFSVKDNGIGMSKEFLGHIFETFTREHSATVSGIQGTGLGMAITKNIVDMMGGDIKVESEVGKGSVFTVTLNMQIGNGWVVSEPIPELLGAKALIVDDSMDTCRSVSKMLRDIQMRPDWTTSGKEAIVRAQDAAEMMDEYRVYIIDYLMPDMNGIETVRRIRKIISADIPIIVLTAYDWSDFESEARQAGVTAFVSKPIFMSELRNVLTQPAVKEGIENLKTEKEKKKTYDYCGKRVLLAEDNELNREIATAILEEAGMKVDSVNDGDVAVTAINNAPADQYDLIFMDIQMPKMDGYTATREIRTLPDNRKANIPIIAMTANAFEEDRRKSYESGMNGHIIKPISIEEIAKVLDEIFAQK